MILPTIVPLMENEYLYSYLQRIIQVNGFRDVDGFIRAYVFPGTMKHLSNLEMNHYLNGLFDALLIPYEERTEWIRKTTIYPALSVWMSEGQKAHLVESMALPPQMYPHLLSPLKPHEKFLKYCPECMQEDIENYGFAYAHRDHQIPGVRICTKHNRLLERMNFKTMTTKNYTHRHDHDLEYAKLCIKLLTIPTCKKLLVDAICNLLTGIDLKTMMSLIKDYPYPLTMNNLEALRRNEENYLNFEKMTSLLLCLMENFHFEIPLQKTVSDHGLYGFDMLNGDDRIATFKHESCGTVFFTTPYALRNGWGCPACDHLSEQDQFEKLVETVSDHQVKVIDPFQSLLKKVAMKCLNCGKVFYKKPVEFLENNSCCNCQCRVHAMTESEAKVMVEKDGEFKLIKFTNANEDMRVTCLSCHHTFSVKPMEFKKRPFCRKCADLKRDERFNQVRKNNNDISAKSIRRYVKRMTGDAYEVIKIKDHEMTLKCKNCQKVFTMTYEQFKRGNRCSCYHYPCGSKFIDYVDIVTDHEYKVERTSYSNYLVTHVETGTRIQLTKLEIMAELNKPGQSDKMPVKNKRSYPDQIENKVYSRIHDYLKSHFHVGDEFKACEILIDGLTPHSIRNCLSSTMIEKHIVMKKKRGIYIYVEVNK